MSSIGPSSSAALNLAGSFAGAQRTSAQQDETKSQQAAQKFQVEQAAAADKDVMETEMDADRDADGRQLSAGSGGDGAVEEEGQGGDDAAARLAKQHAPDAFGLRGGRLDVDA